MVMRRSRVNNRQSGVEQMGDWVAKRALGALALLAVGCSGHDILLSTGNGGGAGGRGNSADVEGVVGDVGGTSYGGGGVGDGLDYTESGEAGRSGWVAYDADLSAFGNPGRHIQIATTDGVCKRPLTSGAAEERQPAFSPDGKQIAFVSNSGGLFELFVMDLASGVRTQLTFENEGVSYPSWSPDGKTIAYVTADAEAYKPLNTLMLIDTATRKTTRLTEPGRQTYTWSAFASHDLLLVSTFISLIGIHTDTQTQYEVVPYDARVPWPLSPSISPDRSLVVFSDGCDRQQQLYVARVDGTTGDTCANAQPLAPHSDELIAASWGPNGDVAAETGKHDIVLVASDGAPGFTMLADTDALERNPAFAPNAVSLNCTK
jgi:WD40 repeat protein